MRWDYRETVLLLLTLAFFVTVFGRLAVSPLVPEITATFGVSNTLVGFALTGMWMAYGLVQFPSGVLADRYGERPIVLVAIGGTGIASLLIAVSPGFEAFVVFAILLGLLAGFHYAVATTLLSRLYDNVGTAIGVHTVGSPIAGLVAPIVVVWIATRFGWRLAVLTTTGLAIPVFLMVRLRVRPTEPRNPTRSMSKNFSREYVSALLVQPKVAFSVGIIIICYFVWQATASFMPTFFVEHHGKSTRTAAIFFSAFFAVQVVVTIGIGGISDRYGRDPVTAACLAVGIGGLTLLIIGSSPAAIALAVVLTAIGVSSFIAVAARLMDILSEVERGAGFGLAQSICNGFGSLGPVTVGFLADTFGWDVSFGFLLLLFSVALAAYLANFAFRWGY